MDGRIWTEINVLTSNLIWLGGRIWIETLCRPEILLYIWSQISSSPMHHKCHNFATLKFFSLFSSYFQFRLGNMNHHFSYLKSIIFIYEVFSWSLDDITFIQIWDWQKEYFFSEYIYLVLFLLIAKNILKLKITRPRRGMMIVKSKFKYCL